MILTLEVIGELAESLGAGRRKVFNAIGGTIGRLPDNDWVFPDPYVSGRHALVRYRNGQYFIEDTSTNGVFINTPDRRLARGESQQLAHGDLLYIDAYEIKVIIENESPAGKRQDLFAQLERRSAMPQQTSNVPASAAEEDRTASLGQRRPVEAEEDGARTEWFGMSGAAAEPRQAVPEAPIALKPQASRQLGARRSPPQRAAAPSAGASTSASQRVRSVPAAEPSQLETLLEAAGIEGLEASHETARMLGEVLHSAVEGLMEVLRARERMKDELRLRATTFKAAHNNPLKFSANLADAFHNLLVKRNPAYLAPPAAFEDALRDVREHQAALFAAQRLAFEAMLAQFDPDRLQEEFDRQLKKGSILGVPAKLRYWDLYRDRYSDMVKDGQAAFRNLFGDELAKVYEEQLEHFKARHRSRDP